MCCRGGLSLHTTVLRDHKADRTFQHSVAHTLPFQIDRLLLSSTQEAHKETKHNVGDVIMTWTTLHVICIEPKLWSKRNPFQLILLGVWPSNGTQTDTIPGEERELKKMLCYVIMTASARKELSIHPPPPLPLLQSWMVQKLLRMRWGGGHELTKEKEKESRPDVERASSLNFTGRLKFWCPLCFIKLQQ